MAISLTPSGCPLQLTRVTLRPVVAAEEDAWNALMQEKHFLGNAQFAGHQRKYVAEHRGQAVALLCFSACAYHLADRDRWLGWSQSQAMQRRHFVVQNSRFLVLGAEPQQNLASRVLGLAARQVPDDWRRHFGFAPLVMETFVDPVQFHGTCYQAAGWTKIGQSQGFRRDAGAFYAPDSSPKDIWVKELHEHARELLRAAELPAEWAAYATSGTTTEMVRSLKCADLASLFERLQRLPEARSRRGRRYSLGCCLSVVFCGLLAGCIGLRECVEFAKHLTTKQLQALRSWRNPHTRQWTVPSHVTLWRVLKGVNASACEEALRSWLVACGRSPQALALDGKVLRATLENAEGSLCAVSLVSHAGTPLFSRKK